jgi:hypothetical protein
MKNVILMLLSIILLNSCSDDGTDAIVISIGMNFIVVDKMGNDLLDPKNESAINENDIKILYLVNGEVKKGDISGYIPDYPNNFLITESRIGLPEYVLTVFLNSESMDSETITYLQWNENDTDTIKSTIYRSEEVTSVTKVWLNDSLVWDGETHTKPECRIVKDGLK